MKIGRNNPCPCFSGRKYKHCCIEKPVQWEKLADSDWPKHLSVRGKNIFFLERIAEALKFDSIVTASSRQDYMERLRRALTPDAVRKIHEAIPFIWPDIDDYKRVLRLEKDHCQGLFLGRYVLPIVQSVLNRHGLYHDKIMLVDPILDRRIINPKYSPVLHPEEHVQSTFTNVNMWIALTPWIEAGIVRVVRSLGDFDVKLTHECWDVSRSRCKANKELADLQEEEIASLPPEFREMQFDQESLSAPDEHLYEMIGGEASGISREGAFEYFKKRRSESPYFANPERKPQLLTFTTGTNYEMGKHITSLCGAHIITDLGYRWREMELDRKEQDVDNGGWEPLAEAFGRVQLSVLEGIAMRDVLKLHTDGYLEDMRTFLRRVWRASSKEDRVSQSDVEDFTAELHDRVRSAEQEWKKIDANLLKWFSTESFVGCLLAADTSWIPAATVAGAGAVNLIGSKMKRKQFCHHHPAGFLVRPIRDKV